MAKKSLLEKKIVAVSDKRRVTIPKKFYNRLNFGKQVECFTRGNELVFRSVGNDDFSDLIAVDLKAQGIDEKVLPAKLSETKTELRESLNLMIADAKKVAHGEVESASFGDIFGDD